MTFSMASTSTLPTSIISHAVEFSTVETTAAAVQEVSPPSYSHNTTPSEVQSQSINPPYAGSVQSCEALPVYEETTTVEPPTLARSLWRWGFLCPFIWILGCFM